MRCAPALILLLLLPGARVALAARFVPPLDRAQSPQPLVLAQAELAQNAADEAARRVLSLRRDGGPPVFQGDRGLIALDVWIDSLPPQQRRALAGGLERVIGGSAERARAALPVGAVSVEALLGIAEQFPLTEASRQCMLEAARQLAGLGDVDAAVAVYERARRREALLTPEDRALVERLAVLRSSRQSKVGFVGVPPFEANWFARRQPYETIRVWPTVHGASVIVVGPTRIVGGSTKGLVEWVWSVETLLQEVTGKLPDKSAVEQLKRRHPRTCYEPGVLDDLEGRPQIVVARQPSIRNPGFLALRAVSATDGRLLWSTDRGDAFDSLSFVSSPLVAGRSVYVAARKRQRDAPERLVVLALETGTGRLLWETTLGDVSDQPAALPRRESPSEWNELFAEMTAPALDGDRLYLNPGGSSLVALDRFTGTLRWVHLYDEAPTDFLRNDRLKSARRDAAQRFRTTPLVAGELVLLAPRDSILLLAVSRSDGRGAWTCPVSPAGTLVGAADGIAVLVSVDALHGVRIKDGTVAWTNPLSGGKRPTGPGVVFDGAYWAPLPQGLIGFALASGESLPTPTKRVPGFRGLLSAAPLRAALIQAGVLESFIGSPEHRDERDRRED